MRTAQELLDDYRNTKRASCMSEYSSWLEDVVEYLEQEVHNERGYGEVEDPTIANQLDLPLEEPRKYTDCHFQLLEEADYV